MECFENLQVYGCWFRRDEQKACGCCCCDGLIIDEYFLFAARENGVKETSGNIDLWRVLYMEKEAL